MRLFPALLALLVCLNVFAAEGMWQPHQLPALGNTLRDLGLEVDPAQLNSLTEHPMAAIVGLGGCSASFVSPDGLAVTNHHCVQGSLQHNSTPERNLLELGFLAEQRTEELPGRPGSRIYVTVEVTDVTAAMLEGLDADTDGLVRQRTLETREKSLVAECERQSGYRCNVYMFYQGLEFYLIRQLEIRDVRLVYVPPRSIGAYGGDIDNWMWPRHTGDYSFLRAYVAPDGSPAEYDQDNVPYKPEHYLAVSTDGLEDGDFAMAVGYPGRTYRHRLALEAADVSNWFYPTRKQHFEEVLAIIERETRDREDAAIKYSALVQGLNNVIKNYGGMIEGFARSGLVDRKRRAEVELRTWLADNDRQDDSLAKLGTLVREYRDGREQRMIYDDFLRRRAALLSAAATLYRLSIETEKPDNERKIGFQERDRDRIRERMTRLPRSYDPAVDQAMLVHHVEAYSALPADQRIAALDRWLGGNDAGIDTARARKRINDAYGQTRLGDSKALLAWLDAEPGEFRNSDDPFIQLAVALYDNDIAREDEAERYAGRFQFARSQYMATLSDWYEDLGKPLYPDANSTLRVTFGIVKGYQPRDAVIYEPFTHVSGVIEKHTGENPFDSPPALLAAIDQQMSSGDGNEIPVNFLATLDSTGGNSGSAVLDSQGELVGLLFDGNYESINADWYFDEAITRTICVDMRYVLWIMDTVDGAHHLLREMGIGPRAMQAYELN